METPTTVYSITTKMDGVRKDKIVDKIINELSKLNKEIADARTKVAVLEGKRDECLKRLKEEHGLKSLEAATTALKKTEAELEKIRIDIENKFKQLREDYSW